MPHITLDKNIILSIYPEATQTQINMAIKYQDKFQLTYKNLKCSNPKCNNIKKWNRARTNFSKYCSTKCSKNFQIPFNLEGGTIKEAKMAIFLNLSYNELKCFNHNCKKIKKWGTSITGFLNTCGDKKCKNLSYMISTKKGKETYFKKTGFFNPKNNPEIKNKILSNNLIKYGVDHPNQIHIKNYNDFNNINFILKTFINENNNFELYNFMEYFNCSESLAHRQIKKLNIMYSSLGGTSLKEQNIVNYLQNHFQLEIIQNNRQFIKPQELDIYLPELQLAIEYNGSYWHSTKDKYYHQQKSIACLEQGIRLLHLYEDQTEEEQYSLIDKFLINEYDPDATTFSLDNGCYPNNIEVEIREPELFESGNFQIYNAGQIKITHI